MPNERELIERSRKGDRQAFAELVRQYQDRIFRLAQKVCAQEPQEAEGVHQDTFVKALEKIQQFENRSALGTWLYRIAANLCFMRLRSKSRSGALSLDSLPAGQEVIPDPAPGPAGEAALRQLQSAVVQAL